MMTVEELLMPPAPTLTIADRCDRCSAQAYTGWSPETGEQPRAELLFCGHHGEKNGPGLEVQGWRIVVDQRHKLLARRTADEEHG